jgi:hypothetical protein
MGKNELVTYTTWVSLREPHLTERSTTKMESMHHRPLMGGNRKCNWPVVVVVQGWPAIVWEGLGGGGGRGDREKERFGDEEKVPCLGCGDGFSSVCSCHSLTSSMCLLYVTPHWSWHHPHWPTCTFRVQARPVFSASWVFTWLNLCACLHSSLFL